jgi:hypothetical protein
MSSKRSLGDVFLLHMYLVVARVHIEFSEVLSTTQLIQEIINDRNVKLVLDCEFIEGTKVRTHVLSTFFLKYHDHKRIIRVGTRVDNTHLDQFLHYFLNFILLGKGMTIRENIGRKNSRNKGYGVIMNTKRRRKSMRSGKNILMFGNNSLETMMHKCCLNCLNRMELRNNTEVVFLEELFHEMGTDDIKRTNSETLEVIPLSLMLELHG